MVFDVQTPRPVQAGLQPKRSRRKLLAILAAAAAVLGGFGIWQVVRPRTIAEVYAIDPMRAGDPIAVQGTITGIERENTSYGPRVYLRLDHNTLCSGPRPWTANLLADPNASYRIGDSFQTTLHPEHFFIDGNPAVWSSALACPFPALPRVIGVVLDGISEVRHTLIVYNGTDSEGWSRYEIWTRNGYAFRADILPVVLHKALPVRGIDPRLPAGSTIDSTNRWKLWAEGLFGEVSPVISGRSDGFAIIDRMISIAEGTSVNGTLRFVDSGALGLLDSGDRIDVRLPSTAAPNHWQTYILTLGTHAFEMSTFVGAARLILVGPSGPLEVLAANRGIPRIDLDYAGTSGTSTGSMTVEVSRVRDRPPALSVVRVAVGVDGSSTSLNNISDLPIPVSGGGSLAFTDVTGNGRLDPGDRFTVDGIRNRSEVSVSLWAADEAIGSGSWIAGWGPVVGGGPYVELTTQGTGPGSWTIGTRVVVWSPELDLTRTLRATLLENGVATVSNVTLTHGATRTFANGNFTFNEVDGDGYLSTGDTFSVQAVQMIPRNSYMLRVYVLFNSWWFASFQ